MGQKKPAHSAWRGMPAGSAVSSVEDSGFVHQKRLSMRVFRKKIAQGHLLGRGGQCDCSHGDSCDAKTDRGPCQKSTMPTRIWNKSTQLTAYDLVVFNEKCNLVCGRRCGLGSPGAEVSNPTIRFNLIDPATEVVDNELPVLIRDHFGNHFCVLSHGDFLIGSGVTFLIC